MDVSGIVPHSHLPITASPPMPTAPTSAVREGWQTSVGSGGSGDPVNRYRILAKIGVSVLVQVQGALLPITIRIRIRVRVRVRTIL